MGVVIGVDIGQRRDPTALCVAESEKRMDAIHYLIRHLERLPTGTSYPEVARRFGELAAAVTARTGDEPTAYVNATGIGQPVVDLLKARARDLRIVATFFNHGDRRTFDGGALTLGKAWLASLIQTLLQAAYLHLPRTPEAEALARDLMDYEIRVSEADTDRPGAFKVGSQDDLVTALGLAVQGETSVGEWGFV